MRNRAAIVLGLALIIIGVMALLSNLHVLYIDLLVYWPVLFIVLGTFLHMVFVLTGFRETSFLFVGMETAYYGIMFQILNLSPKGTFAWLWPFFLLGPPLGFLSIYVFGGRDKDLLIPVAFMLLPWLLAMGYELGMRPTHLIFGGLVAAGILFFVFSLMKKNSGS